MLSDRPTYGRTKGWTDTVSFSNSFAVSKRKLMFRVEIDPVGNGSGSFYIEETVKVSFICFLSNVWIYFILPMALISNDT